MVPHSGIQRPSRTTQSPNPSVILKPNENTDLAMMVMVVRERAQSGRIATWILTILLPHHGRGGAASRNAKTAIPIANQSENEENPKVAKTKRNTGRRNGRSGPGRRNRKAENNLKTSPLPLRPTPVPNPIDLPGVNGPEVLPPSQN